MSDNMSRATPAERAAAQRENIKGSDVQGATVDKDVFKEVYGVKGTRVNNYAPGYSVADTRVSQGQADLDLRDNTTSPGAKVDGDLRWALYASDQKEDLIAKSSTFRSEALRDSVSAARTEKEIMEQLGPVGGQDRYLVLEFRADSGSDGLTLSSSNSTAERGVPYARL